MFRKLSKLAKNFKLTHCFKASGEADSRGFHVFCIYCSDYRDIEFVRKIGDAFLKEGFITKYGHRYKNDGVYALFFKTDNTTHYKSKASGGSLTLFRFTDKGQLSVKEFFNNKPSWKIIEDDKQKSLTENFEMHLATLQMQDSEDFE